MSPRSNKHGSEEPLLCEPHRTERSVSHHSPALFDLSKEVSIEGVVVDVAWSNPHVYVTVETTGVNDVPVRQTIEAASVTFLSRLGVTRETLATGERITVRARPDRRGSGRIALGLEVIKADGAVLPLGPLSTQVRLAAAPEAVAAESIAGRWVGSNESWVAASFSVQSSLLTPAGRSATATRKEGDPEADCVPYGPPPLMLTPSLKTIEVHEQAVEIQIDHWAGVRRVVHLDGRAHPNDLAPSVEGHSLGRWDSNTLVVDTIGFAEDRDWVLPTTKDKHLVERFTITEDRRRLEYEVTIEDSSYLLEPVTFRQTWDYRPDLEPFGVPCDPVTARRFLEAE